MTACEHAAPTAEVAADQVHWNADGTATLVAEYAACGDTCGWEVTER